MRIWLTALLLSLPTFPLSARAEEPIVPQAGWFAGLGGSFNSVNFDQDMFANGVGDVFSGSTRVATGAAGGPANPRQDIESTLAPEAQVGYFAHFAGSSWLWGGKVVYRYVDATATQSDVAPQAGMLQTITGPDSFTGNVVIGSYRTKLDHELAFMPFIGHSFARSYVYLGAGPALFGTQTKIDNAIGFADFNGSRGDVTGTPDNFASSDWVWGGAAQVGATYFLDHDWFLDLNYTYARSAKFKSNFSAPFASSTLGYNVVGTLYVDPSQRVTDQSVSVSFNRRF
jgi:outer membrane protein W